MATVCPNSPQPGHHSSTTYLGPTSPGGRCCCCRRFCCFLQLFLPILLFSLLFSTQKTKKKPKIIVPSSACVLEALLIPPLPPRVAVMAGRSDVTAEEGRTKSSSFPSFLTHLFSTHKKRKKNCSTPSGLSPGGAGDPTLDTTCGSDDGVVTSGQSAGTKQTPRTSGMMRIPANGPMPLPLAGHPLTGAFPKLGPRALTAGLQAFSLLQRGGAVASGAQRGGAVASGAQRGGAAASGAQRGGAAASGAQRGGEKHTSTTAPTTTLRSSPVSLHPVPHPLLQDTLPVFPDLPVLDLAPKSVQHWPQLCPWFPAPLSPSTQTSLGCCQTSLSLPLFAASLLLGDRISLRRFPGEDLCPLMHPPVPRSTLWSPLSNRWVPSSPVRGPYLDGPGHGPIHPRVCPWKRAKIDICGLEGGWLCFKGGGGRLVACVL
ncbi:UNVERIFIED_CONTAM: hypothetical protein FKN15_042910 [Acipenser sinensis]